MIRSFTKELRFRDGDGRLYGFTTGTVSVKKKFRSAKGGAFLSKINFILDDEFTEDLPIWVWVIEHPEGIFVIDTGENAQVTEPDYFKKEGRLLNWLNSTQFRFQVDKMEEVGAYLKKLGIENKHIKEVILTHLHLDHMDGLKYFETNRIRIHEKEWRSPSFALPSLYPEWFEPDLFRMTRIDKTGLEWGMALTEARDLFCVATPGHTQGHISVLLETTDLSYLLAGDVSYDEHQFLMEECAGAHQNFSRARQTYKNIKTYAHSQRMLYLPSHDSGLPARIQQSSYLVV